MNDNNSGESVSHRPQSTRKDKSFLEQVLFLLSIGLGVGAVPIAPGTVGSLLGPFLVWGLQSISESPLFMIGAGVVMILIGLPICAAGIRHYGFKDPKHVVFDEIAAFPFVFAFVPLNWKTAVLGFVMFRAFDIVKPWPIGVFERLPGEWGVMLDDIVAGIIAGILLTLCWNASGPLAFLH
ncbi:Phosphatidylglycerophosphatase A [Thalassoglobus neptunius]|uniref:Phosphatidylglycerophosphatase A n=1 Tax=Thalassoglobus neptunius TaxID=1938619 RepID=A0A5C5XAW0_9PLAN|nr:phosphatidylglycerophosphatase A [Thalassoglobus neptunius]TWT59022.1 Phosphatidylglycerophosphatase A [Thalassoglobus neptunius]